MVIGIDDELHEAEPGVLLIDGSQHGGQLALREFHQIEHPDGHRLAVLIEEEAQRQGGDVLAGIAQYDNVFAGVGSALVLIFDALVVHGIGELSGGRKHRSYLLKISCTKYKGYGGGCQYGPGQNGEGVCFLEKVWYTRLRIYDAGRADHGV